jgi:hypothetical protein
MAAMTDEIVLSKDSQGIDGEGQRVQIETDSLHNADMPGDISQQQGTKVDADLSVAQQDDAAGLAELHRRRVAGGTGTEDDAAALRRRMTGVLAGLPEALKKHLEALMALENSGRRGGRGGERSARSTASASTERMELEESLRRLAHTLHGGLTHKRRRSPAAGASTPAARCAATCASTASRSPRSRSRARRTSRGW